MGILPHLSKSDKGEVLPTQDEDDGRFRYWHGVCLARPIAKLGARRRLPCGVTPVLQMLFGAIPRGSIRGSGAEFDDSAGDSYKDQSLQHKGDGSGFAHNKCSFA